MLSRPTMKITMLKTRRGQFDAFSPFCFYEGRTFNVPVSLARRYIENGHAIPYVPEEDTKKKAKKKKLKESV
jgi:hypothetical protein